MINVYRIRLPKGRLVEVRARNRADVRNVLRRSQIDPYRVQRKFVASLTEDPRRPSPSQIMP